MEKNLGFDATFVLIVSFVLLSSFALLTTTVGYPVVAQLPGGMYWKPSFIDYAPSGVPDFDQRQLGTYIWTDPWGAWSHCGPVAVANSLWWLDSEFEPNPVAPPTINDGFPLVQSYNLQWDDHDSLNVPPLVEHLAFLMDTDGRRTGLVHSGTNVNDMQAGLTHYLSWTGVNPLGDVNGDGIVDQTDFNIVNAAMGSTPWQGPWDLRADIFPASTTYPPIADNVIDPDDLGLVSQNMGQTGLFYEHTVMRPDFYFIEEEVERCQDVVLLVGYWIFNTETGQWYREPGGHYVTVAGVDSTDMKLALSDPVQDAFESGLIPEGRIPVPHVHPPPEPPYITHNDAQYVSQDIYNVAQITPPWPPCPGGNWMLVSFASWRPAPPYFAVIESAVVTSPTAVPDIAVTDVIVCYGQTVIPQNKTRAVNATVTNDGLQPETFTLTVYWNYTNVINSTAVSLTAGETQTVTLGWVPSQPRYGNYTISAYATPLPGETNTANNNYTYGTVIIVWPGDVDADRDVDLYDAVKLLAIYGFQHPNPLYNPNCDIDNDGRIYIFDAVILLISYDYKEQ